MTDDDYRDCAYALLHDCCDYRVEERAEVLRVHEGGAYVAAWIWVPERVRDEDRHEGGQ